MPILKRLATRKKRTGIYKMTVPVTDDPDNTVDTVEVDIISKENQPTPHQQIVILKFEENEEGDRVFGNTLKFDEDASGQFYSMSATMKNRRGETIPRNSSQEVEIQAINTPHEV